MIIDIFERVQNVREGGGGLRQMYSQKMEEIIKKKLI